MAERFGGAAPPMLGRGELGQGDLRGAGGFLGSGTAPRAAHFHEMAGAENIRQALLGILDGRCQHSRGDFRQ